MIRQYIYRDSSKKEDLSIEFDTEKLKAIRDIIIDNCSIVKHYKAEFDIRTFDKTFPKYKQAKQELNNSIIKNVRRIDEEQPYKFGDYYRRYYTYDEYIPPKIVSAINCILAGEGFEPNTFFYLTEVTKTYNPYSEIEQIKQVLDAYVKDNDKSKLEVAKTLIEQYSQFELELPEGKLKDYEEEITKCFKVKPIDNKNDVPVNSVAEQPKKK